METPYGANNNVAGDANPPSCAVVDPKGSENAPCLVKQECTGASAACTPTYAAANTDFCAVPSQNSSAADFEPCVESRTCGGTAVCATTYAALNSAGYCAQAGADEPCLASRTCVDVNGDGNPDVCQDNLYGDAEKALTANPSTCPAPNATAEPCLKSRMCKGTETTCSLEYHGAETKCRHNEGDRCDFPEMCSGTETACPADDVRRTKAKSFK